MGEQERRIRTKHGEVTLEEIAALLPGAGDIMVIVSRNYGNLWHAAHGGNWDLASFYFRRTRTLLRNLSVTRPKYEAQLDEFERDHLDPIGEALLARDLIGFDLNGRVLNYYLIFIASAAMILALLRVVNSPFVSCRARRNPTARALASWMGPRATATDLTRSSALTRAPAARRSAVRRGRARLLPSLP